MYVAYLDIAGNRTTSSEAQDLLALLGILLLLHTSFNAAVYSVMDDQFRKDAKKLCCCCSCIKQNACKIPSNIASSSSETMSLKRMNLVTSTV